AMDDRLRAGGTLLVNLRDYGPLTDQRPTITPAAMVLDADRRRIVHQVWDWQDKRRYIVHLHVTRQMPSDEWVTNRFSECIARPGIVTVTWVSDGIIPPDRTICTKPYLHGFNLGSSAETVGPLVAISSARAAVVGVQGVRD
ncbi:MAG TPA: hypothetical protein VHW25_18715, partial [Steroidobacteraceae bacterium]|nr:hypothetical protein [Steroidobacteraceae bacterium]